MVLHGKEGRRVRCCVEVEMVACRYRGRRAWLCTECGKLVRLDYETGRLVQIWPSRRYGRRAG